MRNAVVILGLGLAGLAACGEEAERDVAPRDGGPSDGGLQDGGGDAGDAGRLDGSPGDSGEDSGIGDAGTQDVGTGTGACLGHACRERIESEAEFAAIARTSPEGACQFDKEVFFVAPKSAGAPVQTTYWIDANVHQEILDFLREDLGGAFATLTVEGYFRTFEREDMSQYWVGRVRRVVPESGTGFTYGFELFGSYYWGDPTAVADIEAILAVLGRTFTLPLGYAPSPERMIRQAENLGPTSFAIHLPRLCPGEACAPGPGPCVIVPQGAQLCGRFVENRNILGELEHRIRLDLTPGNYRLTSGGPMPLVQDGLYGASGGQINAGGDGVAVARDVGGTLYWSIEQSLFIGVDTITLTMDLYGQVGQLVMRPPWIETVGGYGVVNAGQPDESTVQFGDCSGAGLARYFAEADLGNGDRIRMTYRHQLPFAGSGPLVVTGADITLGGQSVRIEDPFDLLYAGVHHNWDNNFMLFFPAPIRYLGHDVAGIWIDEPGTTCCPLDGLRTIDAAGQPLDVLDGTSYLRSPDGF